VAEFKPVTLPAAKRSSRPAPPIEPVQPQSSSHFDVEPYQPTGRVPVIGALLLAVLLLIAATALGIVGSIIEQYYWLIVVFPLALGLALGGVTAFAVWLSRIDAPWFATLMTIAASLYLVFAFHFSDYVMTIVLGNPPAEFRQMSFLQYLDLKTKIGVEFHGSGAPPAAANQRNRNTNRITDGGVYALWAFEAILMIIGACMMGRAFLSTPMCDECGAWKGGKELATFRLGGQKLSNKQLKREAAAAVREGDVQWFRDHVVEQGALFAVFAYDCKKCEDEGLFDLFELWLGVMDNSNSFGRYRHIATATYPNEARAAFQELGRA
jgi:hypothetical protein